jgi:hypothetical protein
MDSSSSHVIDFQVAKKRTKGIEVVTRGLSNRLQAQFSLRLRSKESSLLTIGSG